MYLNRRNMKRVLIALLLLPVFVMLVFYMGTPITQNPYLDRYKGYYICSYDYQGPDLMDFPGITPPVYTRIWFLPFQKSILLNQIKEDINNTLKDVQVSYQDTSIDYEVSEDFKEIVIYTDNYDTYIRLENWRYAIGRRAVLYHDLRQNFDVPSWSDIVKVVYTG